MMKYDRKYISDEAAERYDDAHFALLMEGYSVRLGEEYLEENQRLQESGSFELPPELDARCLKAMDSAIAQKKRRENIEKTKKAARRITVAAASVLLVAVLSTVVLYNTVEAFRVKVVDYTINILDIGEGSIVSIKSNEENGSTAIVPTWLPEGYEVTKDRYDDTIRLTSYTNGNDIMRYSINDIGTLAVDTEGSLNSYETSINNLNAIIVFKEDGITLYWFDFERNIQYGLWADNLDAETLMRIAESCY